MWLVLLLLFRRPRRFRQADIDAGLVPPELLLQDAEEAEESPEFPGPKSGEVSPTLTLLVEGECEYPKTTSAVGGGLCIPLPPVVSHVLP